MSPENPDHLNDTTGVVSQPGNNQAEGHNGIRNIETHNADDGNHRYFESVFHNSFVGIIITDNAGKILQANHAFQHITTFNEEELLNKSLFSFIYPDDKINYEIFWTDSITNNPQKLPTGEHRLLNKLNEPVWVRSSLSIQGNATQDPQEVMVICINIQEEKRAQEKSAEIAKRFRFLADSMPQQIWTADAQGNLNYFSRAFFEYTGMAAADIKNKDWTDLVSQEDIQITNDLWKQSINTGEEFFIEHRLRHHGGDYKWQLSRAMAQKDNHGKIVMWVGATTNIHKQKTIEEQLEKQVLERTRDLQEANFRLKHSNQDLEQFAYIATHDLQEPLRKIRTYSSWINKRYTQGLPEEGQDYMMKIENASEGMSKLIDDLLNYSLLLRPQEVFEIVDLNLIMDEVLNDLDLLIKNKGALIQRIELPTLNGVAIQMHQLFYNLMSNSLKFTVDERTPIITITCRELSSAEVVALQLDMDLNYTEIVFHDNGIGFNQEYAEKIFVIFQRLHNRRKFSGTGIGLALCKKIVLYHHGDIRASSNENEGASFYIYLPV